MKSSKYVATQQICFGVFLQLGIWSCSSERPLESGVGTNEDDTRELQAYLKRFGYLPNDKLMNAYPMWRPLTNEQATEGQLDGPTEIALTRLQENFGLPVTGEVDAAVLNLIRMPRCGFPDNVLPMDPSNKFSIEDQHTDLTLTWRLIDMDDDIDLDDARAEVGWAFLVWDYPTFLRFQRDDTGPADQDILIRVVDIYPDINPDPILMDARLPSQGSDIRINTDPEWTIGAEDGKHDIRATMAHEIGHAIGLGHSGDIDATMFPAGMDNDISQRSLGVDDEIAVRALYGKFEAMVSTQGEGSTDVTIAGGGIYWKVGSDPTAGGFKVYKRVGANWEVDPGAGLVRITNDGEGKLWGVNSFNQIFRRKNHSLTTVNAWELMPGRATDIGASNVGFQPAVWITGLPTGVVRKYDSTNNEWDQDAHDFRGVRIAVDKENHPWVVTSAGKVYRKNSSSASAHNGWTEHSQGNAIAYDIGVYDPLYPFIVSRTGNSTDGYEIWIRNQQNLQGYVRNGWVRYGNGTAKGTNVAVEGGYPDALVGGVGPNQSVYLLSRN